MTQRYTVKINNLYKNNSREITVEHQDAQLAHKSAYMDHLKTDEEIRLVTDQKGSVVYDLYKGFMRS